MTVVKEFFRFFLFIARPLFFNLNSLLCLSFFLLIFNGMNNTITATRMEIPSIEKVIRISGIFVDTGKTYRRGSLFDIGIMDKQGVVHRCNCEPLDYSNCLGREPADYAQIPNKLDTKILDSRGLQTAIVHWLAGQSGEIWMYPNNSFWPTKRYSCYKISSNSLVLRSFEQSVREYSQIKNGTSVYLLWFVAFSGIVIFIIYLIIRIDTYFRLHKSNHQD